MYFLNKITTYKTMVRIFIKKGLKIGYYNKDIIFATV